MGKISEIKDKLEITLKNIDYEIWEYKDQLNTNISDVQKEEIKKELSYLTGRAVSLRETLDIIDAAWKACEYSTDYVQSISVAKILKN